MKLMPFLPEQGQVYTLPYGGKFKCLDVLDRYQRIAKMMNILSGWTIDCHGIRIHEDGKFKGCIEWDYSSGGTFTKEDTNS